MGPLLWIGSHCGSLYRVASSSWPQLATGSATNPFILLMFAYTCPLNTAPTYAMTRSDGYAMVGGIVQGARTYDPTSGQWLTPDAYAGDVEDPMSQKPFMWNANNPVEWSDPSGYCVTTWDCGLQVLGQAVRGAIGTISGAVGTIASEGVGAVALAAVPARTAPGTLSVQDKINLLPHGGSISFIPPRSKSGDIPRDRQGGFIDRNKNSWQWDGTKGEWDVQHPDGSHTNVNPAGEITHGDNNFPKGSKNNPPGGGGGQGNNENETQPQ